MLKAVCSADMPTPRSVACRLCSGASHVCASSSELIMSLHMMSCCMQVRGHMSAVVMLYIMRKGSASYQLSPQRGIVCAQLADLQKWRQH